MESSTTPDFWAAYQVLPERVRKLARKSCRLWQEKSVASIHLRTESSSRVASGQSVLESLAVAQFTRHGGRPLQRRLRSRLLEAHFPQVGNT
jgi:hypothetical protein